MKNFSMSCLAFEMKSCLLLQMRSWGRHYRCANPIRNQSDSFGFRIVLKPPIRCTPLVATNLYEQAL